MKRHLLLAVLVLAFCGGWGALLNGCASTSANSGTSTNSTSTGDFVKGSYKTLATAGITYQTVMQGAATLYANKQITDAQKAQIVTYGNAFRGVYQTTELALEEYVKLGSSDTTLYAKVVQGLADLAVNMTTLQAYATSVGVAIKEAQ